MKKIIALSLCVILFCAFLCGCGAKKKDLKETVERQKTINEKLKNLKRRK